MDAGRNDIDEARQAEIARCVAGLHAANWKNAYRGIFSDVYLDNDVEAERLSHWQKRVPELVRGNGEIFVASVSNKPAGFLCVEIGPEKEWGALVDNLHVLPRFRGTSIGAKLLSAGEDWARRHDQSQLHLWVFEENHAARRFYQREGWREAERRPDTIPDGRERIVWRLIKRL